MSFWGCSKQSICLRSLCTILRSLPAYNKWVAKPYRNIWGDGFVYPVDPIASLDCFFRLVLCMWWHCLTTIVNDYWIAHIDMKLGRQFLHGDLLGFNQAYVDWIACLDRKPGTQASRVMLSSSNLTGLTRVYATYFKPDRSYQSLWLLNRTNGHETW